MREREKIIILFLFSAILNLQLNSVFIKQKNIDQNVLKAHFSTMAFTSITQAQDENLEYNVTLWVKDWEEKLAFRNLNVTTYDSNMKFVNSNFSNSTGHVYLKLKDGSYIISVQSGNRAVGYQEINVTKSETFIIRTWAYSLNVTLVDKEEKPITNQEIFLYDQMIFQSPKNYTMVTDQAGRLINQAKTDGNGTARFFGVWNGTCRIKVVSGETFRWHIFNLQESAHIKLKPYNLTINCVDQENEPLQDHTVFLYDRLVFYTPTNFTVVANQTGLLMGWVKTDENGTAYFNDLWNGTYSVRVAGGEVIGEKIINLQKPELIPIMCNKTYMALSIVSGSGVDPLINATVYIQNSAKRLIFRDHTDQDGLIYHEGVYLDNYTVYVEWMGTQVWSGILDIYQNREVTIQCPVYKLTLRFVDQFGNALPNADVSLRRIMLSGGRWIYAGPRVELETDETGSITNLFPSGTYEVSCSYRIYSASVTINLVSNDVRITVNCNVQPTIWLLTFLVAFPLVGLTLALERKRLRTPMKIRRYKNMLLKLESIYNNGLVEYKTYRKLKEEYEAKLMELGGREMR